MYDLLLVIVRSSGIFSVMILLTFKWFPCQPFAKIWHKNALIYYYDMILHQLKCIIFKLGLVKLYSNITDYVCINFIMHSVRVLEDIYVRYLIKIGNTVVTRESVIYLVTALSKDKIYWIFLETNPTNMLLPLIVCYTTDLEGRKNCDWST